MNARLDATTRAKVDELVKRFHQPRAAVVCHIMHWGLSHTQTETRDGGASEGPVRHLYLYVDTALHDRVEEAAIAAGVKSAPWLRDGAPDHHHGFSGQLARGKLGKAFP